MAIDVDNLDIVLRLIGLRTFQAGMAEARASVAAVGEQAMASDEAMAASSKKTMTRMAMLRKVSLGVAGGLAVTAYESYKLSTSYQQQIEMIHTQAGMTQSQTDQMYKSVLSMSREFPQGPIAMAKGAYHMASVTHDLRLSMDGLRASAKLAAVGNSDLESTTSAVAAVWRAAEGQGLSFNEIVQTLNATVGAGNMRMQDLVGALGTGVLPVFKTGGVTLQDFGSSLALLTDEGQHADNAATHLRMTLTLLAAPSKIARKHLSEIGLTSLQLADALREKGLVGALDLLRKKLYQKFPGAPIDPKTLAALQIGDPTAAHSLSHAASERMNVLARAFGGARSGATIMALIDNLEGLRQKEKQVHDTQKNFGDAVARTMGLPVVKLHKAVSNLQVDLIHFGDTIRGPVTGALLILIGAGDFFLKHARPILIFLGILTAAWVTYKLALLAVWGAEKVVAAGELLWFLGTAISELGVLNGLMFVFDALWMATGIPEIIAIIALALGALIVVGYLIIHNWHAIKSAGIDAFHWVLTAIKNTWHWINSHWPLVASILFGPFGFATQYIIRHWHEVENFFRKAPGRFLRIGKGIGEAIWSGVRWGLNEVIGAWDSLHFKIGGWHVGPVHLPHVSVGMPHIPHFAEGGTMALGGWAVINERARGESVWLPRGSSVQPSPASSLAVPRSHTPNPAPMPRDHERPILIENHIIVDRKTLYKAVTRAKADDKARRGR